jgi:CDP-diglyceride synthetase
LQDRDERTETYSIDPSDEGDVSDFGGPPPEEPPNPAAEPEPGLNEPGLNEPPATPAAPSRPAHARARIEGVEAGVAAGLASPSSNEAADQHGGTTTSEAALGEQAAEAGVPEQTAVVGDGPPEGIEEPGEPSPVPTTSPALQDWREPATREVPRVLLEHPLADPGPAYPGPVWREVESDWDHDDLTFAEIVSEGASVADHGLSVNEPDPFAFDFEVGGRTGDHRPATRASAWEEPDWDAPMDDETEDSPDEGAEPISTNVTGVEEPPGGENAAAQAPRAEPPASEPGRAMHLARVTFVGRAAGRKKSSSKRARSTEGGGWMRAVRRKAATPRPAVPLPAHAPAALATGAAKRNPVVATATGLVIGLLVLLCFFAGPPVVLALVTVVLLVSTAEYYQVLRRAGYEPAVLLGLIAVIAVAIAGYLKGPQAFPIVGAAFVFATMCWYLFGVTKRSPVANIGASVVAWLWVAMLGGFGVLLLDPTAFPHRQGLAYLLGAIEATVAYDVGGYAFGSWIGQHRLAPAISPNKTWEGLGGGCIAAIAVSLAVTSRMAPWTVLHALELGVVVSVFAPIGDLVESMIKRDLKVKDMGTLLPAHGGLLDRVDALLFVLPAAYVLVRLFHR